MEARQFRAKIITSHFILIRAPSAYARARGTEGWRIERSKKWPELAGLAKLRETRSR